MNEQQELREANEKAYALEQEAVSLEIKLDYWKDRCADLEKEIERLQGIQIESTCDHCGNTFMQMKRGRTARFCSASCRQLHYRSNKEFAKVLQHAVCSRNVP